MGVGSARLELYARSRDNGDSLAERDIALFLPVQAFPLSTAHPPALKSLRDFSSLANLASALTSKFEQLGAVDHMTKSIKPHLRALQLSSSDHPVRETRSSSPAISLRMSFEHHDNLNTLAEAIQLHHEALRLSAIGHPFRAQSLVSLGLCLFIQDTDLFDLNRRIILMFEAPSNSPASIGGRLRIALHDVRAVERDQQGEARRQFDMQVEVLVAKIRAFSGLKRFMMPKAFDFLVASLPLGFIVIVNTSEFACHAILLSRTLGVARVLKLQAPLGGFRFRDIWFVCGFENEPYSLGLNLLVEFIILTIPRRRLVVLSELDADQGEQRNLLADLVGRLWNGNGECSLVVQVKILPAHRASDAKLVIASGPLATSLHAPHPSTRDTPVLVEVLEFDKEGLRLRPEGYLERSLSCGKLANSLWTRFDQTGDTLLLDQALELCREALRLRPEGHLHRASSCGMLAGLLMTRFNQTGNTILLEEALELERETLRSRPEGHLLRASSCVNLAFSLRARFNQTGDTVLLYEALALEREALHLRPKGHSERDRSCTSLAISLITFFNQIGDTRLLDEALDLSKEALRLRPMGHPHRAWSCGNLASSLWTRFQQTGDTALLDEAIELEREALHLRPEGHPHRAHSCGNLADSLRARFTQTGQTLLLDEALHLEREALRLRPEGHPQRALSCGNLADSLQACFQQTGDAALLDEAIELEREALHLRPEGHPHRAYSCGNLADSLRARFTQTGQTSLLDEALELNREALRLRPMGHPYHALSCGHLADSLRTCFRQTGKTALLDEAQSVCSHAIECSEMSPSDNVLLRIQMIHILVLPSVLSYSPSTAVSFLLEAIQHRAGLIPHFYSICDVLRLCVRVAVSDEDNVRLLAVYRVLIEVLPELGSVVLDKVSRLHRWRDAGSLPLEALLHALKVNDLPLGLELLEQGRAVLWSQALAMRAPELQGLTDVWKTKLQTLLRSMSSSAEHGNIPESSLTGRDRAHASYTRLQRLLQEIRASPGLERFMRGPSYPELIQVASSHTVVILATGDTVCHAVIISSASAHPVHLTLESIAASDLEIIGNDIREYDSNVRAMPGLAVATEMRRIYVNGRREDPAQRKLHQALQRLWHGIVKPVLDYLGLEVRGPTAGQLQCF
jgi:tetratricopeptide (TPR) repeat protein